jgi:hypothetical protein
MYSICELTFRRNIITSETLVHIQTTQHCISKVANIIIINFWCYSLYDGRVDINGDSGLFKMPSLSSHKLTVQVGSGLFSSSYECLGSVVTVPYEFPMFLAGQ